jgi:hypothetical protein
MPDTSGPMTPEQLADFLKPPHLAIITTNGADGVPHSTPVWYIAEDDGALGDNRPHERCEAAEYRT